MPKEKAMRPNFIQSHTTLIYVFTASKGKKTIHNSPGLTNCHGDSYTHDQTSSRRCKGLGHASTTRGQTLNSRLANRIAFWVTKNEAGRPKRGWVNKGLVCYFEVCFYKASAKFFYLPLAHFLPPFIGSLVLSFC